MEVQAAVGVEAQETAACGTQSRGGVGKVREPPQVWVADLSRGSWTYSAAG